MAEDLAVTDRSRPGGMRIAAARAHAAAIAGRAFALSATDKELASKITSTTAGGLTSHRFIEPPENGGVHAVDFKEAPAAVLPPYPINDVVAEATDLDGNHVVMRRGYYDAQTQQGFGFDKATGGMV